MTDRNFLTATVLKIEQPVGVFYVAAIPASDLLEVCFTDRLRAELSNDGYYLKGTQRERMGARLKEVGKFISQDDVAFPNSIILAANYREADGNTELDEGLRWRVEFDNDSDCGKLIIPTGSKLAAIIDGQHRLFGFTEAIRERKDMPLLCSIFLDLPRPFQAYIFATINSTQKSVDRSQTYELFGYNLDKEPESQWSPDKLSVFLARKLNTERGSPFHQRILVSAESSDFKTRADARKENRWIISMAAVVDGISALVSSNPKDDAKLLATNRSGSSRKDLQEKRSRDRSPLRELYIQSLDAVLLSAVSNFFSAVFKVVQVPENESDSYLTKTVGIQALFQVLKKVSNTAFENKDFSEEYFEALLAPLAEIDFTSDAFKQASGQGRTQIRDAILMQIDLDDQIMEPRKADIAALLKGVIGTSE